MNSDIVKPIPASRPTPSMPAQLAPAGSRVRPLLTASQAKPATPSGLPSSRPRQAPSDTAPISPDLAAAERDAGVAEREHRHDQEGDVGCQRMLDVVQRAVRPRQHVLEMLDHHLDLLEAAALPRQRPQLLLQLLRRQPVAQRHRERHQHARDGRVHAGLQHEVPHHQRRSARTPAACAPPTAAVGERAAPDQERQQQRADIERSRCRTARSPAPRRGRRRSPAPAGRP